MYNRHIDTLTQFTLFKDKRFPVNLQTMNHTLTSPRPLIATPSNQHVLSPVQWQINLRLLLKRFYKSLLPDRSWTRISTHVRQVETIK